MTRAEDLMMNAPSEPQSIIDLELGCGSFHRISALDIVKKPAVERSSGGLSFGTWSTSLPDVFAFLASGPRFFTFWRCSKTLAEGVVMLWRSLFCAFEHVFLSSPLVLIVVF